MIRYLKSLPKHFVSALKSIARHMVMTLSSVSAVAVTLTLMSLFVLVAANVAGFASNVESDLKIHASIDNIVTPEKTTEMETTIKSMKEVKKVEFSSKSDELNSLIQENGEMFSRYQENNPLNNIFVVEVNEAKQITSVTKKLNKMDGIEKAQYGGEDIENMVKAFESLRIGGSVFLIGLAFIAIFLISNTIKMTIYTRKTEISIMRNVGATNIYIKTPFMMEGMLIGIVGALIPVLLVGFGYVTLYNAMDGKFLSSMFVLQAPFPFAFMMCLIIILSGAVVGTVGSFHAVSKYLRWSR